MRDEGCDLGGPISAGWRIRWNRMNRRLQPTYASSVRGLPWRVRRAMRTRSSSFGPGGGAIGSLIGMGPRENATSPWTTWTADDEPNACHRPAMLPHQAGATFCRSVVEECGSFCASRTPTMVKYFNHSSIDRQPPRWRTGARRSPPSDDRQLNSTQDMARRNGPRRWLLSGIREWFGGSTVNVVSARSGRRPRRR